MGNRARGRRTGLAERESIVALIQEARKEGAGLARACEAALIDKATYYRWAENPYGDQRKGPNYAHNKLTQFEHDEVLKICCSKEFADHHPKQIVPADSKWFARVQVLEDVVRQARKFLKK